MTTIIKERYQVHELLGEGGMAEVFRATQLNLDRDVAVKFIKSNMIADDQFAKRFEIEAKAVARLSHPHILQVYDFDRDENGRFFMVMELLKGVDLATYLRELNNKGERVTIGDAVAIVRSVAEALRYAHRKGIVHRDIKPHNIFLTDDHRVMVMDFGIAKILTGDKSATQAGMMVGSPHYFAPEQGTEKNTDHRVDVYALGVVFYELLVGKVPFDADSTVGIIAKHLNMPVPDPNNLRPGTPFAATAIVMRAMAKDPIVRYPDMDSLIQDLDELEATLGAQSVYASTRANTREFSSTSIRLFNPMVERKVTRLWGGIAALIAVILIALSVGAYTILNAEEETPEETIDRQALIVAAVEDIPPATEEEYLIVITQIVPSEVGDTSARRVLNTLRNGSLASVIGERFRVEFAEINIENLEEANRIHQETQAMVVIWGIEGAAGVEVILRAYGYPNGTLNELRFRVSQSADYQLRLTNDLPAGLDYFLWRLIYQRLVRDNEVFALSNMLRINNEVYGASIPAIEPSTSLDEHIWNMYLPFVNNNAQTADDAVTRAIALNPQDPGLYHVRWLLNLSTQDLNRNRAHQDVEEIRRLLGDDSLFMLFLDTYMAFNVDEDYLGVIQLTEDIPYDDSDAWTNPVLFRMLSLLILGEFEEVQRNMGDVNATELARQLGIPADSLALALVSSIRGDDEAAEGYLSVVRASRELEDLSSGFATNRNIDTAGRLIYGGYISEVYGQNTTALGVYVIGLNKYPDNYLLNWRRAELFLQSRNYREAYRFFQIAYDNRPAQFPIAPYRMAELAIHYPDAVPADADPCQLLGMAEAEANTAAEFYTPLIRKIDALQEEHCWFSNHPILGTTLE